MRAATHTTATVAVINDDATQLLLWVELLRMDGYSVKPFASAEQALQSLRTNVQPALIITDVHMPGIDGWRFCRLLRSPEFAAFNKTPVLVVSATFLPSPFLPSELLSIVEQLLAGKTPALTTRVLIVEDEDVVSRMLVCVFASHGYEVTAVRTAGEALRRCQREPQELIILDYHLPDMPGDVLLEEVIRTSPRSAVIMMTGDPRAELALGWMKRGARAYIHKPFDPEYLITLAEKARREIALLHIETRLEERTRDLREKEERYRTLFENVTDALFVHSVQPDGSLSHFLEVNDVACNLLGYTRMELLCLTPDAVMSSPGDEAMASIAVPLRQGQSLTFERRLRAKDGRLIPAEIHARAFTIEGHSAVIALARDITERRQAEADRQRLAEQEHQMQKLESLGVVAGGIAHDFNNILLTILGNVELALEEISPLASAHECLLEVEKAARRAAELSMNMLIYSGRGIFAPQPLKLGDLATGMRAMLESGLPRTITLRFEMEAPSPTIAADSTLVRQIITNLVNNAAEAIGGNTGEIILRTGQQECDVAYLATAWLAEPLPPGFYAFLDVIDNGSGMDNVLGAVRHHRGAVLVTSEPGKGTTLRILLPVSQDNRAPIAASVPEEDGWRGQGTILVVDDEKSVRFLGCRMLEKLGFRTLAAASGHEAAVQLTAHCDEIVAVVLDLTMPNMDGEETFKAL
ncbi:MAG: response regulator, partial [Kiritimatiellaeota bacterium]|nr:response regulator [Kiritimatiellota bacterium]